MVWTAPGEPTGARINPDTFPTSLGDSIGVDVAISAELHEKTKTRMQQLANDMLKKAGIYGIGFDEVREAAERRGILTGYESGRALSFGSAMMRRAGGVVARWRNSRNKRARYRRIAVYVHYTIVDDPKP